MKDEPKKIKKPKVIFTVYDEKNAPYAEMMKKSLRKFHSEEEVPLYEVRGKELEALLKQDPLFFYRQKPVIAEKLIKEYELVIGMDCDQIVTGDLSYLWNTRDYDVAAVLNYNKNDAEEFGMVGGWGINPIEYVNCGLVAMRNEKFIHDWKVWCFSNQFDRLPYKEQDGLNIMIYHGNWNVRILEHGDGPAKMYGCWGLFGKSDWHRTIVKDGKLIIPKGEGEPALPPRDMELKILHWAGGQGSTKMKYKTRFSEEVIKYLDNLTE